VEARRAASAAGTAAQAATWLWILLGTILAARLLTIFLYPAMDTTEARYAEISRLMVESGQWVMLQFEPGVPFWGKPPLFAWLTAGSMALFGYAEWALRLPHFLLGLATLWMVQRAALFELPAARLTLALVVLASTPLFFATAGTVMTEAGLLLSTTLCFAAFWRFHTAGSTAWGLALFAGLGLGMLAKGPVAVVMSVIPLMAWATLRGQWTTVRKLPWWRGCLLALLVAAPWYIAAELRSPGFLSYFLVGEHFLRFVQPGWSGDLYGNAHREVPGMIWLLWFQATAAWGVLLAWAALRYAMRQVRTRRWQTPALSQWQSYLLWWMLTPLLFFTFSGNILWTYVLSGLPAFALLLATPASVEDE
jgi:4-amino-4-deoxy-L-arabinose transferase-like glycosyltransferase